MPPRERGFPSGSRMNRPDTCKRRILITNMTSAKDIKRFFNEERKESEIMRLTSRAVVNTFLVSLFLICSADYSSAQQGAAISSTSAGTLGSGDVSVNKGQPMSTDTRYRIGPGDVLDVH